MNSNPSPFAAFSDDAFLFGATNPSEGSNLYSQWQELPQVERYGYLVNKIRIQVAGLLGVSEERVDADAALNTFVTDSLMVARLHNRLMAGQIEIPLAQFWQQTIHELATEIDRQLKTSKFARVEDAAQAPDYGEEVPEHLRAAGWQPISPMQEVYHNLYQQGVAENPAHLQIHQALWIRSSVDVPALRRACQAFVDRHDGLRVTFTTDQGRCYQKVRPKVEVDFTMIQAQTWTDEALIQAADQESATPWDLVNDLGIKFRLYIRSTEDQLFHIIANHMIMDGWACWMMFDELRTLYQAESTGVAATLPPVGWSLLDYNRWQAALLRGPEGDRLWRYWRKELMGELTDMQLPTDYPRPATNYLWGKMCSLVLATELYQQVKHFIAREKLTYFQFFLAVLQVLLYKYCEQSEVRLATRLANRINDEVARTMTSMTNHVLLRVHLSDELTLQDVCSLAQAKALEGLAHQGYPFLSIAEQLDIKLTAGLMPLARVTYCFERLHIFPEAAQLFDPNDTQPVDFGGLTVESFPGFEVQTFTEGDLGFWLVEGSSTILGGTYYNPRLFKEATIVKMNEDIARVTRTIVTNPEQCIGELKLRS